MKYLHAEQLYIATKLYKSLKSCNSFHCSFSTTHNCTIGRLRLPDV